MLTLAIETSCDETSAAVLRDGRELLSNVVLSQDEVHAPYGGIVPELASRQHIRAIDAVVREALERAGTGLDAIDLFAVTQGPGLIGSLLVGLCFAKGLAYVLRRPLAGVDHLQAHLQAAFLENPDIPYPSLGLLVSGGHTALYAMDEPLRYELLGGTRDDAAGEALDKIAKFLDLGYPGGPVIERLAREGRPGSFPFSRPRTKDRSYDFSFSGLKTAALKIIRERGLGRGDPRLPDFLADFEETVAQSLVRTLREAADARGTRSLVLCGGVARNARLRARFGELAKDCDLPAYVPSPKLCTDNAGMVAALAVARFEAGLVPAEMSLDLDAYPRS